MSDVVRVGAPLPALDDDTVGGIVIPDVDPDKGHPIVELLTDTPGLRFNIIGPEQQDLEDVAQAIADAQLRAAGGDDSCLWFREPQHGTDWMLTPAGLQHVLGVSRGFAKVISHHAGKKRPQLVRPPIGFDDLVR